MTTRRHLESPIYRRFGPSTRFGDIMPATGDLLPDDAYETARLTHVLAETTAPDAYDLRLDACARLALFAPDHLYLISTQHKEDVAAARAELRAIAETLLHAPRADAADVIDTKTLTLRRAQLTAPLALLDPNRYAVDHTPIVTNYFPEHLLQFAPPTRTTPFDAFSARARPFTLDELAALEDEDADGTGPPMSSPSPRMPTPKWHSNPTFDVPTVLHRLWTPPRHRLVPTLEDASLDDPTATPPRTLARRVDGTPPRLYADMYDELFASAGDVRERLDFAVEMNDDDADGGAATPPRSDAEEAPAPAGARRYIRGRHHTPTRPLCTHVIDAATGATCPRQVVAKRGKARFCSEHYLRAPPSAGAYCEVCYWLASVDDTAEVKARIRIHLIGKKAGRASASIDRMLARYWAEIPARRFNYHIERDRGSRAKCVRHRDALWNVPADFVPAHVNPNPNAPNEPPLQ